MTAREHLASRAGAARRHHGFTLIELMVTVAVMAIFSTLAAPEFRRLIAAQRVRAAASALNESLWLARSESIKRNTSVTFSFPNGSVSDWDIVVGTTAGGLPLLHHQDGFAAITSTTSTGANQLFTFNPYGRLTTGTAWVKLEMASAAVSRWVCISSTGRATVQESACP